MIRTNNGRALDAATTLARSGSLSGIRTLQQHLPNGSVRGTELG